MPFSTAPTPERACASTKKQQLKVRRLFQQEEGTNMAPDQRALLSDERVVDDLSRSMDTRNLTNYTESSGLRFADFEAASTKLLEMTPPRESSTFASSKIGTSNHRSPHLLPPSTRDSRKNRRPFATPIRKQSQQDPPASSIHNGSPPSGSSRKPIAVIDSEGVAYQDKQQTKICRNDSFISDATPTSNAQNNLESAFGDDDSTAVAGTTSIVPSTVQHVSPLSSSLVLDQQQLQLSNAPLVLRKPIPKRPPPSPGTAASSILSDLTSSNASPLKYLQQQPEQNTILTKPSHQRPPVPCLQSLSNETHPAQTSLRSSRPPSPLLKAALARPFGRITSRHSWIVEVSSAEWDADERRWKYRILVQQRPPLTQNKNASQTTETNDHKISRTTANSFTTAFTWRSVADFFWLEEALQREFQGALMLPLLSVSLGRNCTTASEMPVESEKLKHWLSDVLNGVRCSGEWNLPIQQQFQEQPQLTSPSNNADDETAADQLRRSKLPQVDVVHCESVETFLYRNTVQDGDKESSKIKHGSIRSSSTASRLGATTPVFQCTSVPQLQCAGMLPSAKIRGGAGVKNRIYDQDENDDAEHSAKSDRMSAHNLLHFLVESVMAGPLELCTGPSPSHHHTIAKRRGRSCSPQRPSRCQQQQQQEKPHQSLQQQPEKLPRKVLDYASRALGTSDEENAGVNGPPLMKNGDASSIVDSIAASRDSDQDFVAKLHWRVIEAEKELAIHYRRLALSALEKLHTLHDEEEKMGAAWKRFAVCLSNLFAHEKDAEHASLGEKIKKDQMPYRKLDKKAIDDCLRDMARLKLARSTPGLIVLSAMLHAFVADLSSVEPAVNYYQQAVAELLAPAVASNAAGVADGATHTLSGSSAVSTSSISSTSGADPPTDKHYNSWDEIKEWTLQSLNRSTVAGVTRVALGRNGGDNENSSSASAPEVLRPTQRAEDRKRLADNDTLLRISLTTMFRTMPFRVSRMAWRYWHTEATQCALLNSSAAALRFELDSGASKNAVSKMIKRHTKDEKADCAVEMDLIQKIINLGKWKKNTGTGDFPTDGSVATASIENGLIEVDNDELNEDRSTAMLRDKALDIARQRIGRWNAALATAVLKAVGITDPNVRVEDTNKDLRLVRKYAIGLRENVDRCIDGLQLLKQAVEGKSKNNNSSSANLSPLPFPKDTASNLEQKSQLRQCRNEFLGELCTLFSGTFVGVQSDTEKQLASTKAVLTNAGIHTSDLNGWIPAAAAATQKNRRSTLLSQGRVGDLAVRYVNARDAQVEWLLGSVDALLKDYYHRVETIESFVFMESLGILLEKHFSNKRAHALAAFEKKTDLTGAITAATRKRMKKLVAELNEKLERLGPEVSHTTVKETKDAHLESKALKAELHNLAVRRLTRARESSTERAIALMSMWAKEEEIQATEELKAVGEAMATLERLVCNEDFEG